ncbi:hypothetical protein KIL84_020271, partial [Mauremys mutica]
VKKIVQNGTVKVRANEPKDAMASPKDSEIGQPEQQQPLQWRYPGTCSQQPGWCIVALILGTKTLLQAVAIALALQALRECCEKAVKTEASLRHNTNHTSVEDTHGAHSLVLSRLKENLCGNKQGTECELCPPEWLLHRGRCYYFSEEKKIWEASKEYCAARKSSLLIFESEAEMVSTEASPYSSKRSKTDTTLLDFSKRLAHSGERSTYAEVKVHWKSDSTSEATRSEDLSGDKSEESDAFESGQASEELSGEASGEPSRQVSGELGWEPSGQSMGQSSLPEESSGSGFDPYTVTSYSDDTTASPSDFTRFSTEEATAETVAEPTAFVTGEEFKESSTSGSGDLWSEYLEASTLTNEAYPTGTATELSTSLNGESVTEGPREFCFLVSFSGVVSE